MSSQYEDFLDTGYSPADDDLVCTFRLVPAEGMTTEEAAARVASESSTGTWAALDADTNVERLSAVAYALRDDGTVRVAYPAALFEGGSLPQVLACIAGTIMGMSAVESIRLADCEWPAALVDRFPGPQFGSAVRHRLLDAGDRPVLATVPTPKVGLSPADHARVGYESWTGGVDLLRDAETLTDQSFNPFEERVTKTFAQADEAESETGERKAYVVNVTADTEEMVRRVEYVADQGGRFVMIDVITAGWGAVQTVRERTDDLGVAIHAHRAMHAAMDRFPHHGVSMRCLAQVARLAGVDHLHTGTGGLGRRSTENTVGIDAWLRSDLHGLADVLPVLSGGLHPGIIDTLLDETGQKVLMQASGGVHGHPDGTRAGARALRAAVDAWTVDESLSARAETVPALATALNEWGTETPR
ncbi:type III ribulose-bisphosphate carboxylase [Halosegnis sp.]|uniref:type III ribulose-bisphosphate carboxylase n=1 Tax=Halosegnis sp. TaxID=2864959 RepID=UPI0035D4C1B9